MSVAEPTVREYERAASETRRRLSSTLDELGASLTPGRMLDEVLSYARAGGGDFLKGLGKAASSNPVPTLLIGVGAALFLSGKGRIGLDSLSASSGARAEPDTRSLGERLRAPAGRGFANKDESSGIGREISAVTSKISEGAAGLASSVREGVASAGDAVSKAASGAMDAASGVVDDAASALSRAGATAGKAVSDAAETVTSFAADARDTVVEEGGRLLDHSNRLFRDLRDRGSELIRDQPLVVAAVGLAMGAAVAAVLPRTETEDSLMGEASDAVKEAASEVAGEEFEQVKSATEKVIDKVKSTAVEEGLSPKAVAGAIRTLGDKVVSAVAPDAEAPGKFPQVAKPQV